MMNAAIWILVVVASIVLLFTIAGTIGFFKFLVPMIKRQQRKTMFGHVGGSKEGEAKGKKDKTPPEPKEKKSKGIGFWGVTKKVVLWIIAILAILWIARFIQLSFKDAGSTSQTRPTHPNFQPLRMCDEVKVNDYSNRDLSSTHNTIKITLVEGCYADWTIVPKYFDEYRLQLSQNVGDYASIWCDGQREPKPIVEYYEDSIRIFGAQMGNRCYGPGGTSNEFRFQGHGVVTITAVTVHN